MTPDAREQAIEQDSHVLNPDAIGDPTQAPIVKPSPGLAALLEATQCPDCRYINHLHADDCEAQR